MKPINITAEGLTYKLMDRDWEDYHGITLISMVLNEEDKIEGFLKDIRPFVNRIVIIDGGSIDKTVELALPLVDCLKIIPFEGHHANQKNRAIELSCTDWTLLLDADEKLSDGLKEKIRGLIDTTEYDCYSFPRREFRDGKEDKLVYPDYQERLFRTYCRLIRPIHHELVGWSSRKKLPTDKGLDIIHSKSEDRHIRRNTVYGYFERHYKYEIGIMDAQTKEGFAKRYPHLCNKLVLNDGGGTSISSSRTPKE